MLTMLQLWNKVTIPSGSARSFYIWISGNDLKYKQGSFTGAVTDYDSYVNIYDGAGTTSKFTQSYANIYSPRSFVGMIRCGFISISTRGHSFSIL